MEDNQKELGEVEEKKEQEAPANKKPREKSEVTLTTAEKIEVKETETAPSVSKDSEAEQKDQFKRAPSKLTQIKDLGSGVNRVSLVGTIVNKNSELYSFLMDDGTGTVLVLTNDIEKFKNLQEKQIVRVLGKVWGEKDEIEIQADIIQDFSKIDLELFRKIYK